MKALYILFILILCSQTLAKKYGEICPGLEMLPETLEDYLDFNQEFAFHDIFVANFESWHQEVSFNISSTSAVRFYVAPEEMVDIDLWLYNATESPPSILGVTLFPFFSQI